MIDFLRLRWVWLAAAAVLVAVAYGIAQLGSMKAAIFVVAAAVFLAGYSIGATGRALLLAAVICVANGAVAGQSGHGLLSGSSQLVQAALPLLLGLLFLVIVLFGFFAVFSQHHRLHSRKTGSGE